MSPVTDQLESDEPLTVVMIEQITRQLVTELTRSQQRLASAREREVTAKSVHRKARNRALLSQECPRVKSGGATAAERDAWVETHCEQELSAWEVASVARENLSDELRAVTTQASLAQTLARSVGQAYSMAGAER